MNRQLEAQQIIMSEGRVNIIDATPVEAAQSGPGKGVAANSLYGRINSTTETPRPFARTSDYFGPDRHRIIWGFIGIERRCDDNY